MLAVTSRRSTLSWGRHGENRLVRRPGAGGELEQAMTRLTEPELRALLTRQEGQFLEFKSAWDLSGAARSPLERRAVRDFIAENVAAFADAEGGTLVVGVDDDGLISGHGYPPDEVAKFLQVPASRLRSPAGDGPVVAASQVSLDGQALILFEVTASPSAVMVDGDGFPFRVGDRVIQEPQEVINERKQAYRRVGFEPKSSNAAFVTTGPPARGRTRPYASRSAGIGRSPRIRFGMSDRTSSRSRSSRPASVRTLCLPRHAAEHARLRGPKRGVEADGRAPAALHATAASPPRSPRVLLRPCYPAM